MCCVSMIADYYGDKFKVEHPQVFPPWQPFAVQPEVSRLEFEELKKQVSDMTELLKRAKAYDAKTGQPDCEVEEKMEALRTIARLVGIDLDEEIGKAAR